MADAVKNPKGIRVRNDNLYVDFTYKHVRYRESLNLPPLPKNIKFAAQLLYDIHRAIKLNKYDRNDFFSPNEDAPKTTLKSYFEDWIVKVKIEDRTRITYISDLKALIGLFGSKELRDIGHKDLQRWVDGSQLAAGTVHNRMGTLSSLYNHAILNDACSVNPVVKVTLPKRPPSGENIKAFSRTEMQTILTQLYSAGEYELHRLVWFMCETGLRISEAFCLRYGDLHLKKDEEYVNVTRSLNVREKGKSDYRFKKPKNSRTRRVSLVDASIAAVKGSDPAPIDKRDPTAYIFTNPRSGLLWDSSHLNDGTWRVMLKRCCVPYRPLKCLRHTFASLLVSSDYNLLYVSLELGHSSVKVTQDHYAKYLPDAVNEQRQRRNSQKTWGEFK